MTFENLRIVFMGTPEFAVASLHRLIQERAKIVGVVTSPDRVGGRGRDQVMTSAIKKFAVDRKLRLLQPKNLKSKKFNKELEALKPDLIAVVAFRMLPEVVWSLPPMGTINLHASLLPAYRGAAPINWAIINGERLTGLTTFFIQKQIDTGQILLQEEVPILPDETAGELHDRMKVVGADLLYRTLRGIASGSLSAVEQDDLMATKAPKIYHHMAEIDFDQPLQQVYNFVRGMSPYPGAWTLLNGKILKIKAASMKPGQGTPYQLLSDGNSELLIGARGGWISVKELQLEGRKQMDVERFLLGYKLTNATINRSKQLLSSEIQK